MRKFYLLLITIFMSICSASAQDWYVGGSLGFKTWSDVEDGESQNRFSLNPEIGYNLSDKWAVGVELGFSSISFKGGGSSTTFNFKPYARWNFYRIGDLSLFGDIGFDYSSSGPSNSKMNSFSVGVEPGLAYDLNDSFALVSHLGFIGFTGGDNKSYNGFEINVYNDISFGFYYKF